MRIGPLNVEQQPGWWQAKLSQLRSLPKKIWLFAGLAVLVIGGGGIAYVRLQKLKPVAQINMAAVSQSGGQNCQTKFSASPVALKDLAAIFPMGKMSGHGHITPTDHQYWIPVGLTGSDDYVKNPDKYAVYAPGNGTIVSLGHLPDVLNGVRVNDFRVEIDYGCGVHSANMHVGRLTPDLKAEFDRQGNGDIASVNIPVKAGQQIGTFGPRNLDFMVWDDNKSLPGFIAAKDYEREPWKTHVIDPIALFSQPLKSQLKSKMLRQTEPTSGKIDYDQDGYLVGNWFKKDCDINNTNPAVNSCDLTIAYDPIQPTNIIVSLSEFGGDSKPYAVNGNSPDPATVGINDAPTKYQLVNWSWQTPKGIWHDFWGPGYDNITFKPDSYIQGTILFQLTDKRQLKMETFPGKTSAQVTGFTAAAKMYER